MPLMRLYSQLGFRR